MAVKLKDIAELAGVSKATVSLALNDSELVNEETKKKIKKIAKELEYSPNAMARSLVKQKSSTIGLVVPDIDSAYYGKLVKCIDDDLREAGYGLILAISGDKPEIEKRIIGNLISNRVDGVIVVPVNHKNSDAGYLKQLGNHSIPFIFATARYPEIDAPYVMMDLEEGTYKLVRYLLDLGHRNIIFLAGFQNVITTSCRINGYIRAYKERGLIVNESNFIECKKLDYDQACEVTDRLIKSGNGIDAIITINDIMALGVINTLKSNHINIPEDISVAGYDNMIFSMISSVPITTIRQDMQMMSWNAVNMILSKIKGEHLINEEVLIKPELIIRESTGIKK